MGCNLVIDIGNTRTKFGLFQKNELLRTAVMQNDAIDHTHELLHTTEVSQIIISSVNRSVEFTLQLMNKKQEKLFLSHLTKLPIQLEYDQPETLGKDRIAAVVAASQKFPRQEVLVIDAGTCITYDFLTAEKKHLGGAIAPGVQMRLKAMNGFTDKLPLVQWADNRLPPLIGNSTITSMLSGAVNGAIKEMKGFVETYQTQYPNLKTVITGGDAIFFEKALKNGIFADPNLVLKGLNEILIYNSN